MSAKVPAVGAAAAIPGYNVSGSIRTTDAPIRPTPAHPIGAAIGQGIRVRPRPANARMPPAASSHARVGSEKYAHGAATDVSTTQSANDPTNTPPATSAVVRRGFPSRVARISSAGQNR